MRRSTLGSCVVVLLMLALLLLVIPGFAAQTMSATEMSQVMGQASQKGDCYSQSGCGSACQPNGSGYKQAVDIAYTQFTPNQASGAKNTGTVNCARWYTWGPAGGTCWGEGNPGDYITTTGCK